MINLDVVLAEDSMLAVIGVLNEVVLVSFRKSNMNYLKVFVNRRRSKTILASKAMLVRAVVTGMAET